MIRVEVFSEAGKGKHNEDYVVTIEISPEIWLIVVCDGMGGLLNAAEAAKIVAVSIAKYLLANFENKKPEFSILNAILYANEELAKENLRNQVRMGSAVAVTLFMENHCYYSWLGDVRIYFKRKSLVKMLTQDHLAIEGNHSILTRCIKGRVFRYPPVVSDIELQAGDEILIASDGYYLYNTVEQNSEVVRRSEDDASFVRILHL